MKTLTMKVPVLLSLLFMLLISGCASIGPRTVETDSFNYNGVLADAWKQRMLFNMVRMRYGDTPYFLDVASVINQYSLETGVSLNGQVARTGAGDIFLGLGGHGTYTDRPTVTYTPVSGETFARSLMRPLPPAAVMSLIEAGYSIDLVMRICVQSINGIRNRFAGQLATKAADEEFYLLLERLQRIQNSGALSLRMHKTADKELLALRIGDRSDPAIADDVVKIRQSLGLDPATDELKIVYGAKNVNDKEIAILTRSLLQIINDLASDISVPEEHVSEQLATPSSLQSKTGRSEPPLIRIKSSPAKPDQAFVTVPYQSHWFWIDNRDIRSKKMFSFLMFLFSLTETGGKEGAPIVTISAGG